MNDELYLILHKVRGEPAFDIAQQLQIGEELGWIIPTSGHRAYPYQHWDLSSLADIDDINAVGSHSKPYYQDDLPPDWPDHYQISKSTEPSNTARNLLAAIGLAPKSIKRRKLPS